MKTALITGGAGGIGEAICRHLASDGYPVLKGTLAESERELERIINNDPLCIDLYKATKGVMQGYKSFDDRTYIRIAF